MAPQGNMVYVLPSSCFSCSLRLHTKLTLFSSSPLDATVMTDETATATAAAAHVPPTTPPPADAMQVVK